MSPTLSQVAVMGEIAAIKAVQLIFSNPPAQIGEITLDASVRELHKASAKATRHPIEAEEGSPSTISDHVLVDPLSIQIEGVVSNTPTGFLAGLFSLGQDPVHDAHQTLIDNVLTGAIVTVVTTLMEYPDMLLESVEVTRDASKGNALHFSATATQINRVSLVEIAAGLKPVSAATKAIGRKKAQAARAVKSSAAFKLLTW